MAQECASDPTQLTLNRTPVLPIFVARLDVAASGIGGEISVLMANDVVRLRPKIGVEMKHALTVIASAADFIEYPKSSCVLIVASLLKDT